MRNHLIKLIGCALPPLVRLEIKLKYNKGFVSTMMIKVYNNEAIKSQNTFLKKLKDENNLHTLHYKQ